MAEVKEHPSDQSVALTFPGFDFTYGDWGLTVTNPGGLRHTLKKALVVRYAKPVDVHLSVGWAPKFVVLDSWYQDTWNKIFYPAGVQARLTTIFLKQAQTQWGAELEAAAWLQDGGIPTAVIHSRYASGGANGVVTWLLLKQLHLTARVGGGVLLGSHSFDYQGTAGSQWTSVSPYAAVGGGIGYTFLKYFHADAGLDLIAGLGNGYFMGFVQPTLGVGASY
jgi:hypothetical protein